MMNARNSPRMARSATRLAVVLAMLAGATTAAEAADAARGAPDTARGAQLWRKCASCHTLDVNGRDRAGPRLHGIFGRTAGAVPDYNYSDALKKSGIVWTDATLDAYIKDAEAFLPGTKMYGGLSQDEDRADLLAFLKD